MKKHLNKSLEATLDKTAAARNAADYEYTVYRLMCQHLEENGVEIPDLACMPEIAEVMFVQFDQVKESINQPNLSHKKSRKICYSLDVLRREFEDVRSFSIDARKQLYAAWLVKYPESTSIL